MWHNVFRATLTGFFLGVQNIKKHELATQKYAAVEFAKLLL